MKVTYNKETWVYTAGMDLDEFLEENQDNYYSSYEESHEGETRKLMKLRDGDTEDLWEWLMDSKEDHRVEFEEVKALAQKFDINRLYAILRAINPTGLWNAYDKVDMNGDDGKVLCMYYDINDQEVWEEKTRMEWATMCGFENGLDMEDTLEIYREKQLEQYRATHKHLYPQTA